MLDEPAIIEIMKKEAGRMRRGYSPIGDDVAYLPSKGRNLIIKSDMLVGKTDVPRGMSYFQAGRKSVAMCVSDFASKGVRPLAFLVSLGLKRGTSRNEIEGLARGIGSGSRDWQVKLVGGDVNEADDLIIDCAMFGFASNIVPRNGARPGDFVVTTGTFGYPSAGLQILLKGAKTTPKFRRKALRSVYLPRPKLSLGLALSKYMTSSMDSSDGLAICLHALSESGVGMMVEKLPCESDVRRFAELNSLSLEELVLYGGEEYEIVGTVRPEKIDGARRAARKLGERLIVIGRTSESVGEVKLLIKGRMKAIKKRGWIHFRN